MRIYETGQHRFAAQIDHLRVPVACAAHFIIAAYRQDAPARAVDSHSLRSWLRDIQRIDCAIQIKVDAHANYCLEIKYTLGMIIIPPAMVVGKSWSCNNTIASIVPSNGWMKSVDAATEPSMFV